MKRAIIMGGNPYVADPYKKDAATLFDATGGNTGNLAFQYAVVSHLPSAAISHWGASPDQVRAAGDVIVMPLANQLGSHTDLAGMALRLEQFNLPAIGVGLGAQSVSFANDVTLSKGTEDWLKTIARLAPSSQPNIGARGAYTQAQIARYGLESATTVTGCPSNFINTDDAMIDQVAAGFTRKPQVIAVAAGIPHVPQLASVEQDLADIVTLTGGAYIVQHGLDMLRLARNEFHKLTPESLAQCHAYILPNASVEEFMLWCRRYAYAFYDARGWMDFLRRFDFVVGTRFHGAMLAIQAGVPAACIAHDSRTQEMCETMGVPVRHHTEIKGGLTRNNIMDFFQFDAAGYKEKRRLLGKRYVDIYKNAGVGISRNLEEWSKRN